MPHTPQACDLWNVPHLFKDEVRVKTKNFVLFAERPPRDVMPGDQWYRAGLEGSANVTPGLLPTNLCPSLWVMTCLYRSACPCTYISELATRWRLDVFSLSPRKGACVRIAHFYPSVSLQVAAVGRGHQQCKSVAPAGPVGSRPTSVL